MNLIKCEKNKGKKEDNAMNATLISNKQENKELLLQDLKDSLIELKEKRCLKQVPQGSAESSWKKLFEDEN